MSRDIRDAVADLDGLAVHYREAGEGEPIVFLHGAGGRPPEGASFVAMLAARHRVLIPSRPGFDETPLGHCESLVDVADVMAAFVERVADGAVHVVAQSAGATVGCWLAVRRPALVESLVLSAPAAFAVRHGEAGDRRPGPAELAARLYGATPSWSGPPSEAENERIRRNAAACMARFQSPDGNRDLLDRLADIEAPTLVLWATDDRMLLPESVLPYQAHIPNCHRIYVYGAAHELPISAAPQWVGLVSDFIERGEAFVVNVGGRERAS